MKPEITEITGEKTQVNVVYDHIVAQVIIWSDVWNFKISLDYWNNF